jgi:hypothetical protein
MKIRPAILLISILLLLSLGLSSCKEKVKDITLTPDRDAAETTGGALAIGTGGAIDQISDLCEFLSVDATKAKSDRWVSMNKSYDSLSGYWTIHLERLRGLEGVIPFAHTHRLYTMQYLNANGDFQKYYKTGVDTARTVHFNVKRGWGVHQTRRISQQLDSLAAEWTVTDAHLPNVTINGTYYRAAVDTISGFNRLRTSNHQLNLNFSDVVVPRGSQPNLYAAISGHVTGSFHAVVTFLSGSAYSETTIDRTIDVTMGGGRGNLTIGNKAYVTDLYTGEVLN